MNVLQCDQYGMADCNGFNPSQYRLKRLLLALLRREVEWRVTVARREGQKIGQQRHRSLKIIGRLGEHRLQFLQPLLSSILPTEFSRALHLADNRIKRAVGMLRRAEIAQAR